MLYGKRSVGSSRRRMGRKRDENNDIDLRQVVCREVYVPELGSWPITDFNNSGIAKRRFRVVSI